VKYEIEHIRLQGRDGQVFEEWHVLDGDTRTTMAIFPSQEQAEAFVEEDGPAASANYVRAYKVHRINHPEGVFWVVANTMGEVRGRYTEFREAVRECRKLNDEANGVEPEDDLVVEVYGEAAILEPTGHENDRTFEILARLAEAVTPELKSLVEELRRRYDGVEHFDRKMMAARTAESRQMNATADAEVMIRMVTDLREYVKTLEGRAAMLANELPQEVKAGKRTIEL